MSGKCGREQRMVRGSRYPPTARQGSGVGGRTGVGGDLLLSDEERRRHQALLFTKRWLLPHSTFLSIMNDIIFTNFCNMVEGSTYVKGTRNTKIESLSQQACGVLDRMINRSTGVQ